MARLAYVANTSVDGYTEDPDGNFDWSEPSEEVHAYINDLVRPCGIHLYGRRMYETMAVWETDPSISEVDPYADFAQLWQAADKIVYSTTLDAPLTRRTAIERSFEPDRVRDLKQAATSDLMIGGPEIAAQAFAAGLVDDVHLFVHPIAVGGGKPALPLGQRLSLELRGERRFDTGIVHLHHRVTS